MGISLCSMEEGETVFPIEELGIQIYSMEELNFIIYEHPMLVMDGFVKESLVRFIEQFSSPMALHIEKLRKDKAASEEILLYILRNSLLYNKMEVARYKARLTSIKNLSNDEYLKAKADYMFELGKYGKAIEYYNKILRIRAEEKNNKKFLAMIYHNMASSYANMFLNEEAYYFYTQAYALSKDEAILKKLYFSMMLLENRNEEDVQHFISGIREESVEAWNEEYDRATEAVGKVQGLSEIENALDMDRIKRHKYFADTLLRLKENYRRIV